MGIQLNVSGKLNGVLPAIVVASTLSALPGSSVMAQTFNENFRTGCLQGFKGNQETGRKYCTCMLSFMQTSFSRLGFNVLTPMQYPDIYEDVALDGGRYCTGVAEGNRPAGQSYFMRACLDEISRDQTTIESQDAAICACVEDELDIFDVSSADRARLDEVAGEGSVSQLLQTLAIESYPGLNRRARLCSSGRSPYQGDPQSEKTRAEIDDIAGASNCARRIAYVANACVVRGRGIGRRADIKDCEFRFRNFHGGDNACDEVSTSDVERFVEIDYSVPDQCLFWSVDPARFAAKLNEFDCETWDTPTRLRIDFSRVPLAVVYRAEAEIERLSVQDASIKSSPGRRQYLVTGLLGDEAITVILEWPCPVSVRECARNPMILNATNFDPEDLVVVDISRESLQWTLERAMALGDEKYAEMRCKICHQLNQPGEISLEESALIKGPLEEAVYLAANGLRSQPGIRGHIRGKMSDEEIAALLTFFLNTFGQVGEVLIQPEDIANAEL